MQHVSHVVINCCKGINRSRGKRTALKMAVARVVVLTPERSMMDWEGMLASWRVRRSVRSRRQTDIEYQGIACKVQAKITGGHQYQNERSYEQTSAVSKLVQRM